MTDVGVFFKKAIEFAEDARRKDDERQFKLALDLYRQACQHFEYCIKHHKSPAYKERITSKVTELRKRIQDITDYLDREDAADASDGVAAAQKKGKGDDNDKLRNAITGAIVSEKPNVQWDDVAGLEAAKAALKEAVTLPVLYPQLFTGNRRPWKGILLYGPPGTGKTHLAKAVATAANATFFSVSSADLMSKWLGESEKLVRELFQLARENSPSIVFIDEIDSLCGQRSDSENDNTRRVKTEFLVQMQGVGNDTQRVLVLAATNTPWTLDSGIRRRFERRIYIPLPDPSARAQMFRIHLGDTPNNLTPHEVEALSVATDTFSGSDVSVLVRAALMEPIRKLQDATHFRFMTGPDLATGAIQHDLVMPCSGGAYGAWEGHWLSLPDPSKMVPPPITYFDFLTCLETTRPSVSMKDLADHETWTREFGQSGE